MTETLNTIIQAIKLLESNKSEAAEFILRQEVENINRKFLMGIVGSKDITGSKPIKKLLTEFLQYVKDSEE